MRPAVYMDVDTSRFDAALKQYLLTTKRDLHKAINARFFYLMVRLFVLVPPRSPGQERRRISDYLGKPLGDINRKSKKTFRFCWPSPRTPPRSLPPKKTTNPTIPDETNPQSCHCPTPDFLRGVSYRLRGDAWHHGRT